VQSGRMTSEPTQFKDSIMHQPDVLFQINVRISNKQ